MNNNIVKKIKKSISDKTKVKINKLLFPIKYIESLIHRNKVKKICYEMNIKFYSDVEMVNKIVDEKKSLSRFGDGEFLWLLNIEIKSYQKPSEELSQELKNVIKNNNDNLIIGLPNFLHYDNLSDLKLKPKVHWINFINKYGNELKKYIISDRMFGNTQFSRFYIDYKNKRICKEKIDNLKRIWNNKEIVIIEGNETKMGVGNDLFNNSKNVERIICPSRDAFEKKEKILESAKKYGKNKMIILALGPTATILAKDICELNIDKKEIEYQAIDLGHLDIEYEWYLQKAKKRKAISGKFVNEVRNMNLANEKLEGNVEKTYNDQIICKID